MNKPSTSSPESTNTLPTWIGRWKPDPSRFRAVLRATIAENPWIKQVPTATQSLFLAYEGQEALFGGAAGGGKSSALLMAALQYANVPGYAALLLRRTYTDLSLPGALMDRCHAWLKGTAAKWQEKDKTWRFPSGASLTFGYLESDADKYRYQSSEFQFVGFDEVTQFEEAAYLYLFSRLRRLKGFDVPLRMRAASNPGGTGHAFVKQRFLVDGLEAGRLFVPSKLTDNPHIDQEEYRASLMQLDPFTRAQLLSGDWDEHTGGLFQKEWFPIIDTVPALETRVRAWDLASTEPKKGADPDYTVGVLMGRTREKEYVILDVQRIRSTPLTVQALVRGCAERDGRGVPVYMEEEAGSSGKIASDHFRRNILAGFSYFPIRSTGSKRERAAPFSSMAEGGHVKILRAAWNTPLLDELAGFPTGAHDDQVDACSLAFSQLSAPRSLWIRCGGETINRAAADPFPPDPPKPQPRGRIDADSPGWGKVARVPLK